MYSRDVSCHCKNFCDGKDNQRLCLILVGSRIFGEYVHYQKIYHPSTWQARHRRQDFPVEEVLDFWWIVCLVRSSMYAKFAISICFGLVVTINLE